MESSCAGRTSASPLLLFIITSLSCLEIPHSSQCSPITSPPLVLAAGPLQHAGPLQAGRASMGISSPLHAQQAVLTLLWPCGPCFGCPSGSLRPTVRLLLYGLCFGCPSGLLRQLRACCSADFALAAHPGHCASCALATPQSLPGEPSVLETPPSNLCITKLRTHFQAPVAEER